MDNLDQFGDGVWRREFPQPLHQIKAQRLSGIRRSEDHLPPNPGVSGLFAGQEHCPPGYKGRKHSLE